MRGHGDAAQAGSLWPTLDGNSRADIQIRQDGDWVLVKLPDGRVLRLTTGDYAHWSGKPAARSEGAAVSVAQMDSSQTDGMAETGSVAIGMVDKLAGTVRVRHADGRSETIQPNAIVYQQDQIETDADGSVGIIFADRSTFSLGAQGRLRLDQMVYDPEQQQGQAHIEVLNGPFSLVSGQIAKSGPNAMMVKTPVMSIAVRGTTVAGQVAGDGQTQLVLLPDINGLVGQVTVQNGLGLQVLTQVNTMLSLSSAFQPPPPPVTVSPLTISQTFSESVRTLPVPPGHSTMEWSTKPGAGQTPPVLQLQQRDGADKVIDPAAAGGLRPAPSGSVQPSEPGLDSQGGGKESHLQPQPLSGGAAGSAVATAVAAAPGTAEPPAMPASAPVSVVSAVAEGKLVDVAAIMAPVTAVLQVPAIGPAEPNASSYLTLVESESFRAATHNLVVLYQAEPSATSLSSLIQVATKLADDSKSTADKAAIQSVLPQPALTQSSETASQAASGVSATGVASDIPSAGDTGAAPTPAIPPVSSSSGRLVDGPIANATLFRDMDGDGIQDADEDHTVSAADGTFTLKGTGGTIIALPGGVDQETGLTIDMVLKASGSASVVTPLTTLAVTVGEANLKAMLGLDADLDLSQVDPMGNAALREAGVRVLVAVAAMSEGIGALGISASPDTLFAAMARHMSQNIGAFDLGAVSSFRAVLQSLPGVAPGDPKITTLATLALGASQMAAHIVQGTVPQGSLAGLVNANLAQMAAVGLTTDLSDAAAVLTDLAILRANGITRFHVVKGSAVLTAVQAEGLSFSQSGTANVSVVDDLLSILEVRNGLQNIPLIVAWAQGNLASLNLTIIDRLDLVGNVSLSLSQWNNLGGMSHVTAHGFGVGIADAAGYVVNDPLTGVTTLNLAGDIQLSLAQYAALGSGNINRLGHRVLLAVQGDMRAALVTDADGLFLDGDVTLTVAQLNALSSQTVNRHGHLVTAAISGTVMGDGLALADHLVLTGDATLSLAQIQNFTSRYIIKNGYHLTVRVTAEEAGITDLSLVDLAGVDTILAAGAVMVTPDQADCLVIENQNLTSVVIVPPEGQRALFLDASGFDFGPNVRVIAQAAAEGGSVRITAGSVDEVWGAKGDDVLYVTDTLPETTRMNGDEGNNTLSFALLSHGVNVNFETSDFYGGFSQVEGSHYDDTFSHIGVTYANAGAGIIANLESGIVFHDGWGHQDHFGPGVSQITTSLFADTVTGGGGDTILLPAQSVVAGEILHGASRERAAEAGASVLLLEGSNDLRLADIRNMGSFCLLGENTEGTINASQILTQAADLDNVIALYSADGQPNQKWRVMLDSAASQAVLGHVLYGNAIVLDGSTRSDSLDMAATYSGMGFIGGRGNDSVRQYGVGSSLNETLSGGAGQDRLILADQVDLRNLWDFSGFETISFDGTYSTSATLTARTSQLSGVVIDAADCAVTLKVDHASGLILTHWDADDRLVILGSSGNDTLVGAAGIDYVDFADYGSAYVSTPILVNLAQGTATGGMGNDQISMIEGVIIGSLVQKVVGDANDNIFVLNDISSLQTIVGGAGLDRLVVPGYASLVSRTLSSIEEISVSAWGHVDLNKSQFDTLTSLGGEVGSQLKVVLTGSERVLDGSKAQDADLGLILDGSQLAVGTPIPMVTLTGGVGHDSLYGGNGNDTLFASVGGDFYGGGLGTDRVQLNSHTDLTGATFSNVEYLALNGFTATMSYGQSMPATLMGSSGNDRLVIIAANTGTGQELNLSNVKYDAAWNSNGTIDRLELYATAYADSITGSTAIDALHGGDGDDWIYGGSNAGGDTLYGDAGNDLFVFTNANASINGLVDGGTGYDTVLLNGTAMRDLSSLQLNQLEQIQYGNGTAVSTYTLPSAGLRGSTMLLTGLASANLSMTVRDGVFSDFSSLRFDGVAPNSLSISSGGISVYSSRQILGTSLGDTITGDAGWDMLDGGTGNDTLNGNGGTGDLVSYASATSAVSVNLLTGTASGGNGNDVLLSMEGVVGSLYGDSFTGTGKSILSYANATSAVSVSLVQGTASGGAGQDVFSGFDTLIGSLSADYLIGDGDSWLSYANATSGVTVDLLSGTASGGAGLDQLSGFVGLIGSSFDDTLLGSAGDDILIGGLGNDWLNGGSGGHDVADYGTVPLLDVAPTNGAITVNLTTGTVTGSAGNDSLTHITHVIGSAGTDTMIGSAGDDTFDSGGGSDTLLGNDGDDTFILHQFSTLSATVNGGNGVDTVDLSNFSTSCYLHLYGDNSNGELYYATMSRLFNVEKVIGGSVGDFLCGSTNSDTLLGGGGNDYLGGLAGDDWLDGGSGDDWACYSAPSSDAVSTLVPSNYWATSGVQVDLTQGTATGGGGNDHLVSIENIQGSAYNDRLVGDGNNNILNGGGGIDSVTTGAGQDVLLIKGTSLSGRTMVVSDFDSTQDSFSLSNILLGLGSSGSLAAGNFAVSTRTLDSSGYNYSGGASTAKGIVLVGDDSGMAGVDVWYSTDIHNANTSNSYQIASLEGCNTSQVRPETFTLSS